MATEYSEQERALLAEHVMHLLEDWRLQPPMQLALLGLEASVKPRHLSRFKHGNPLSDDQQVMERVVHLLGIRQALERNHPMNRRFAYLWLNQRSKYFTRRTPLEVMLEDGLIGMRQVWENLDCTMRWD